MSKYPIDQRLKEMGRNRKWLAGRLEICEATLGRIIRERIYWAYPRYTDIICRRLNVDEWFLLGLRENASNRIGVETPPYKSRAK